jgi:hypothetical protein
LLIDFITPAKYANNAEVDQRVESVWPIHAAAANPNLALESTH